MSLIEPLQMIVPAAVSSYMGPLLIVSCFVISFRHWLHAVASLAL
jgi:hypothetical protein